MELVLVGQPYSGKSSIFNDVVGYKSISSNAPGSQVNHNHGEIELEGEKTAVVDLPGIYSLQVSDNAGDPAVDHLLSASEQSVLINVIDASVLSRSLELTLQLMELKRPMLVVFNMVDEAKTKGIVLDAAKFTEITGLPVVETVAKKGEGVFELFQRARELARTQPIPKVISAPPPIEKLINELVDFLHERQVPRFFIHRFMAIKLIERDPYILRALNPYLKAEDGAWIEARLKALEDLAGQRSEYIMSSARHNMAFELFEAVAKVGGERRYDIRHQLDALLMHPLLGYLFLIAALAFTFTLIYKIGNAIEPVFIHNFKHIDVWLAAGLGRETLSYALLNGAVTGFGGGIVIVIPYLLPFFLCLAFLEDSGYLPRIAYLTDNLMHRIGLHGMSVVPIIMGYGCSVPGVLATRILKSPRDKFITATLTSLIPCSARMTIIFGLVGFFISMKAAIFIYVFNLVLIGLAGKMMSLAMPEESPGLIMEIPRYHLPGIKVLANKTWIRLKEFIVIAWPILIIGSVALELINHWHLAAPINNFLSPYTAGLLGFPAAVGTTLLFGIMRKELALILLFSALGTSEVAKVMSAGQILSYTFFVSFYVPCLATFATLAKELNWRKAVLITAATLGIVSALTVIIRMVMNVFTF